MAKSITERSQDYSKWYNDIVLKAGLADYSPVRGCMIIRPYGFAIWENIKSILDGQFKATGHVNACFPLLIPKSFFSREAAHVEGFAKECAVVTHYRLMNDPEGNGVVVDPDAKLEEELIIRPTSETIIWNAYKDWIKSYRDLPILINQWANVMRWEMRTRLFLRTAEFFWQEGHTAHETAEEAQKEANDIHELYAKFMREYLALPVIKGVKTEAERFAGAVDTFTVEALMPDGKAIQMGTSHFLGQNFAKAFDVKFQSKEGKEEYVYATSWGVTTRMIGAMIMAHSDDEGLVLPPKLAPTQVVIVPIYREDDQLKAISEKVKGLTNDLDKAGISWKYDDSDQNKPGWKFAEYEMQGVPVRIAIGPRDLENNQVELARRDTREKSFIPMDGLSEYIANLLDEIQQSLYERANGFLQKNIRTAEDFESFKKIIDDEGGFVWAHWDGTGETEAMVKDKTKASIRCIPFDMEKEEGTCIFTGKPSKQRVLFAKSY